MRLPLEVVARREFPLGFSRASIERKLLVPDATNLIRYARMRGGLERLERGRYRSRVPLEIADACFEEFERARDSLLNLDKRFPGALDEAAAVLAWTRGSYVTGLTPFRTVVSIAVPTSRMEEARRMLSHLGVEARSDYPSANELGVFAKLNPVKRLERTLIEGVPVISRRTLEAEIDRNRGAFGPAREYIEDSREPDEVLD